LLRLLGAIGAHLLLLSHASLRLLLAVHSHILRLLDAIGAHLLLLCQASLGLLLAVYPHLLPVGDAGLHLLAVCANLLLLLRRSCLDLLLTLFAELWLLRRSHLRLLLTVGAERLLLGGLRLLAANTDLLLLHCPGLRLLLVCAHRLRNALLSLHRRCN